MDIQPTMGLGLSANIRLQMNLMIEKSALLAKLGNLPLSADENLLVPIMWFDDSIERPPTDLLILLGDALSTGDKISRGVLIFSSLLLFIQILLCSSYLLWKKSKVESCDVKEMYVIKVENNWFHAICQLKKTFSVNSCSQKLTLLDQNLFFYDWFFRFSTM